MTGVQTCALPILAAITSGSTATTEIYTTEDTLSLHDALPIFTGTSGVQFVGYTLAVLAILGTAKVAVALLVLGVPIIDTFWIIVRRVSQGRSPFSPDRTHIHHRLLDLGLSHRQTVFVIYGICFALAVLSLLLSGVTQLYAFLGIFVAFGLILFLPTRGGFRRPDAFATYRVKIGRAHV